MSTLDPRCVRSIFIGLQSSQGEAPIVWVPNAQRIMVRKDCTFYDRSFLFLPPELRRPAAESSPTSVRSINAQDTESSQIELVERQRMLDSILHIPEDMPTNLPARNPLSSSVPLRRSSRKPIPVHRLGMIDTGDHGPEALQQAFGDLDVSSQLSHANTVHNVHQDYITDLEQYEDLVFSMCLAVESDEAKLNSYKDPQTFIEAVTSRIPNKWMSAIDSELASITDQDTWTFVLRQSLPKGVKTLTTFKTKQNELRNHSSQSTTCRTRAPSTL